MTPQDFPRDLDLFRSIMLCLESGGRLTSLGIDQDRLDYHLRLMIDAGLIRGRIDSRLDGSYSILLLKPTITNAGHDLLATIRADTIWNKITSRLLPVAGGITLEILAKVAKDEVARTLGITLD